MFYDNFLYFFIFDRNFHNKVLWIQELDSRIKDIKIFRFNELNKNLFNYI